MWANIKYFWIRIKSIGLKNAFFVCQRKFLYSPIKQKNIFNDLQIQIASKTRLKII